jgi:hypothetical protein
MEIRDRLKALEVGADHRDKQLAEILTNLNILVADLHERRGRDAAFRVTHTEDREDKFQLWTWIRAFFPVGVLFVIWDTLINLIRNMWNGAAP